MAKESSAHTLQPTTLVHEAWLRLTGEEHGWKNRGHFLAAAAEAMRRILIDSVRRKKRVKHGGELQRVELEGEWCSTTSFDYGELPNLVNLAKGVYKSYSESLEFTE